MMGETPLMIMDVPFQLVRMAVFLLFIVVVTIAFITVFKGTQLDYAGKVAREVGETILSSSASDGRGVLVMEELDKYKMGDEPLARHCSYGYAAEITGGGKTWKFGMEPQPGATGKASREFPIGLKYTGDEYVKYTGKMTITVQETMLTQFSCLLESAYENGEKQTLTHTLTSQDALFADVSSVKSSMISESSVYYTIRFALKNGELCAVNDNGEPMSVCRKTSVPFDGFRIKYKYGIKEAGRDTIFAAIPVKEQVSAVRCDGIPKDAVATTKDEIKAVTLCVDDKGFELA